jgi:NTP pyrophosphatase (non-canonical NTP hydrolase)
MHLIYKKYSVFVHTLQVLILFITVADVTNCFILVKIMPTTTSSSSSSSPTSSAVFVETSLLSGLGKEDTMYESNATDNIMTIVNDPRSCILRVGANAGKLCQLANEMIPSPSKSSRDGYSGGNGSSNSKSKKLFCDADDENLKESELVLVLTDLFISLWATSQSLKLNWIYSIRSKMKLNAKKYPVEHCKGKASRYTEYSHLTGITTTNQSTVPTNHTSLDNNTNNTNHQKVVSLEHFTAEHLELLCGDITTFAIEREWIKYHQPRNLIMAMLGEVGELSELLQYDGEDEYDFISSKYDKPLLLMDRLQLDDENSKKKLDKLSQELADVTIYALRLVTVCNVIQPLKESLLTSNKQTTNNNISNNHE